MGLKGLLEVMNNFEKVKAKGFRACKRSKFTKATCQSVEKFKKIESVEINTYFKI
jgi:methylphosphotriester-DNA--protein-cysteine methyltransferase